MERHAQGNVVETVVAVLRKATRIVQIVPFAYLCFYAFYMLFGNLLSEETLYIFDVLFFAMPSTVAGMLVASHLFKLCAWHKVACLIPTLSQIEGFIDSHIVTFTQEEISFINIAIGVIASVFLFAAFRHFVHGFKRVDKANA